MSKNILKHCMVVHNYYPIGEPRVQREAEALKDNGYEVDVICLRQPGEPPRAVVNQVNIYRLSMRRHKGQGTLVQFLEYLAFFCLAFLRLISLYFQRRYRVIQVHNLPDFLVFVAFIPRLMGAKVILDLHDLMPEFSASRFGHKNGKLSYMLRLQERLACRFADQVITVTEFWRQTLIGRGVPPEKCTVVMNTADDRIFNIASKRNGNNNDKTHFNLLYHGTLARRYGIDLILRALKLALRETPDIYLTVHGRGEYLEELQQLSEELGLGDHVKFSSHFIPMDQLSKIIADADLGIVPYRHDIFTDGILPTKLMEYAAMGVPAIVARTPVITLYFDETMVEFFTSENVEELAGCIQLLYRNRTRLDELAKNIQKFNQNYNWFSQKAGYVNLVKNLATSGS